MAKAKNETVEQPLNDKLTVENLQQLLNEQKDEYKKLEEEKVSLVAKLQHLKEQDVLIAELKIQNDNLAEAVTDLHEKREEWYNKYHVSVNENEEIVKKLEQEIVNLKSILPGDVIYSQNGEFKYKVGAWVRYQAKYQNLRFQVRQHLGIGTQGPLYRLYQYDHDISLNNIPESELLPVENIFRHE